MKNKIFLLFIAASVMLSGCKKSFFDINDNPNAPTEEDVLPKFLLPMVLNNTAKKMAIDYDYAAHWMGYWARGYSYGPSIPLENYVLTNSYETGSWVNGNTSAPNPTISWYDILKDAKVMENKAKAFDQPFYVGAAKVVKTIAYMYLVDLYNNVPYTEALDINHIAPKYDKGEDIYADLLVQLDSATLAFSENFDVMPEMEAADVMFGGDIVMWRKLINTQRLKLLIHQADYLGTTPTAELQKIINDGNGFIMSGETAEVQPGYSINKYKLNPFYAEFLMDENENLIDDFNRANNFILNKYRDNNDERYIRVFSKATNPVDGLEYAGNNLGNPVVRDAFSSNLSNVAGPGLAKSAIQPQWLFTSVESLFLQAEATQRGWLTGDAQTVYRAAVSESFIWLGVEDAVSKANTYLDNEAIADWSAATNKIELIINQKYLALCGINNMEAWTDYRRTGFPSDVPLSLNSGRGSRVIPLRLLYPQNEYSYNTANVNAQGNIDSQTSKIFWDVN